MSGGGGDSMACVIAQFMYEIDLRASREGQLWRSRDGDRQFGGIVELWLAVSKSVAYHSIRDPLMVWSSQ